MSFQKLFETNKRVFIPFFILGFPTLEKSVALIQAAIDTGCQAIELGIPFADATADGQSIQNANATALSNGANFSACLEAIQKLRQKNDCPFSLLVYANLIYPHQFERLALLQQAGINAILTVDIPINENAIYQQALENSGLESCYLIAPNTSHDRIQLITNQVQAYSYLISDYGTTGVRSELPSSLKQRIQEIKSINPKPLVVGFGIHEPAQAKQIFDWGAEGAIVGSALVKLIQQDLHHAEKNVVEYVAGFVGI